MQAGLVKRLHLVAVKIANRKSKIANAQRGSAYATLRRWHAGTPSYEASARVNIE